MSSGTFDVISLIRFPTLPNEAVIVLVVLFIILTVSTALFYVPQNLRNPRSIGLALLINSAV